MIEEDLVHGERAVFVLKKTGGANVDLKVQRMPNTRFATLLLSPSSALAPNSSFELSMSATDNGAQERSAPGSASHVALAHFQTGGGTDDASPRIDAIARARFVHLRHAEYKETAGPWAELRVNAKDDGRSLVYEVFSMAVSTGPTEGPAATIEARNGVLFIGRASYCARANFEFPPRGKARLGLRAVDMAGNKSDVIPLSVDVDHPIRVRDRP